MGLGQISSPPRRGASPDLLRSLSQPPSEQGAQRGRGHEGADPGASDLAAAARGTPFLPLRGAAPEMAQGPVRSWWLV